jgi:hypothetical protein
MFTLKQCSLKKNQIDKMFRFKNIPFWKIKNGKTFKFKNIHDLKILQFLKYRIMKMKKWKG